MRLIQAAAPEGRPGPGWFPDPLGGPRYRYWDGSGWTTRISDEPTRGTTRLQSLGRLHRDVANRVAELLPDVSGKDILKELPGETARERREQHANEPRNSLPPSAPSGDGGLPAPPPTPARSAPTGRGDAQPRRKTYDGSLMYYVISSAIGAIGWLVIIALALLIALKS